MTRYLVANAQKIQILTASRVGGWIPTGVCYSTLLSNIKLHRHLISHSCPYEWLEGGNLFIDSPLKGSLPILLISLLSSMSDTFVGSVRKEDTIYRNGVVPDKSFQNPDWYQFCEDGVCFGDIIHISCQLLRQATGLESGMYLYSDARIYIPVFVCLIVVRCSSAIRQILGTPTIIFEIWTALVARSEHIALLNGPSYAMLVSCQISMVLCSLSTQPTVLISTPFGMTKVFHVLLLPYTSACKIFLLQLT